MRVVNGEARPVLISEIFGPVIQGEGLVIGTVSVFIRTQGCDYQCEWCDTKYANDRDLSKRMNVEDIIEEVVRLSRGCTNVTLTGGNPLLQELGHLVDRLHDQGFLVTVETQGSLYRPWVEKCDTVALSPKPPSSGHTTPIGKLKPFTRLNTYCKVVVFSDQDLEYAKEVMRAYVDLPMVLQPGNNVGVSTRDSLISRMRWIAERMVEDPVLNSALLLPQLHVLMYGNERCR